MLCSRCSAQRVYQSIGRRVSCFSAAALAAKLLQTFCQMKPSTPNGWLVANGHCLCEAQELQLLRLSNALAAIDPLISAGLFAARAQTAAGSQPKLPTSIGSPLQTFAARSITQAKSNIGGIALVDARVLLLTCSNWCGTIRQPCGLLPVRNPAPRSLQVGVMRLCIGKDGDHSCVSR